MTCRHCGTRGNDGDRRCKICGRTPSDTLTGEYTLVHNTSALAVQPIPRVRSSAPQVEVRIKAVPNLSRAVQRSLFNVVPIETYTTAPPRPRPSAEAKPPQRSSPRRARVPEEQASLDFLPAAASKPRTLDTEVEAMIYCEERVASPLHRAFAAALDWSMVLIGYGFFLAMFYFFVGGLPLTKTNLLVLGAVLPLFGLVYGLVWALAGAETAGMKWTKLRLTTFEGFPPERPERLLRFGGSCLSLCTVVGVLWALADEEGLAWQDHISRTFPTPRRADSQVFHRR